MESLFEEVEMEVAKKKDELLTKLQAEVKEAEDGMENLLHLMSEYRKLPTRAADTISFIKVS